MILLIAVVYFAINLLVIFLFFPLGILMMITWCVLNLIAGFQRGVNRV